MIPGDKKHRDSDVKSPMSILLPKLLLVEGETPKHFFEVLLRHLHINQQIEIRSFGGVNELPGFLQALPAASGLHG